ncbi:MAG: hypothetical protein HFI76_06145 [Lachnospiraceae bacterium]|nr:hypothetical protein [Lachnospiraceae bacterium]
MNKEEILSAAQKEGTDEREVQIKDKSIKWTYLSMVIAAAIFSFLRENQGYPIMDLTATVSFSVCIGQFYRYIKGKDKLSLLLAVIMLAVAIFATIRFFMGH